MAYVVTDNCIKCKYTDCVDVCPVDCFHEGPNFLVIDPEECIDCTLCEPECPAEAIYAEDDVPAGQENFIELNYNTIDLFHDRISSTRLLSTRPCRSLHMNNSNQSQK